MDTSDIIFLGFIGLICAFILVVGWRISHPKHEEYEPEPKRDIEAEVRHEIEIMDKIKDAVNNLVFSKASKGLAPEVLQVKIDLVLKDNGYDELMFSNQIYIEAYCKGLRKSYLSVIK